MAKQEIIISENLEQSIAHAVEKCPHDKLFVLTDVTTKDLCWPMIEKFECLKDAIHIVIGATDVHKNLETIASVWKQMGDNGGTRHSLMINLGGGMVTDLGGFAASTFKRGINYINIPTTLRKDWHQLQRAEERDWRVQPGIVGSSRYRISEDARRGKHCIGLCRDAEARRDKQYRELE